MPTTLISQVSELAPYLDRWRQWAPSPMQSPEWLLNWWQVYQTSASRLAVLLVHNSGGTLQGIAPFYFRDSWLQGRSVRFLGSGRVCSDFQSLLAAPGQHCLVAETVAQWLGSVTGEQRWDFVELQGIAADDEAISQLSVGFKQRGCWLQTSELAHTWRLDLSGGWEGYLQSLSRTQRRQTRNIVNRFDKNEALTVSHARSGQAAQTALDHCMELHQRRWNASGEIGCFFDGRFRKFVQQACLALADRGQLDVILLADQGKPIAGYLYLYDTAGNGYMYQSGRDPQREADAVGRMLNALVIRAACQENMGFIDYLRGDELYKARLGAVPTKCLRLRAVAPAPLPRCRHRLWSWSREVKHGVQSLSHRWTHAAPH